MAPPVRSVRLVVLGLILGVVAIAGVVQAAPLFRTNDTTATDGNRLFQDNCVSCHGVKGDRIPVAPLDSREFLDSRGDASLIAVIGSGKGVMPGWGKARGGPLSADQVLSIVGYLSSAANRSSPAILAAAGQNVYAAHCAQCHGTNGDRVPVAPLDAKPFLDLRSDAQLTDVVARGKGSMPGMGGSNGTRNDLSRAEILSVVAYLRSTVDASVALRVDLGRSIFVASCLGCHGERGDRIAGVALASPDYLKRLGDSVLARDVLEGKGVMPPLARSGGASAVANDVAAIAAYLKTWAGLPASVALSSTAPLGSASTEATAAPGLASPSAVGQAKDLFLKTCAGCHGETGDKVPNVALLSPTFNASRTDAALITTITQGTGKGMSAFGQSARGPLSDADVHSIVAFLRAASGTSSPLPASTSTAATGGTPAPVAAPAATRASAAPPQRSGDDLALISHGQALFLANCTGCHGDTSDTPGKLGDAAWLQQRGERAISQSIAGGRNVPGAPLAMPPFGKDKGGPLDDTDIAAIIAYFKSIAGLPLTAQQVAAGPDAAHGKDLFSQNCAACHGPKGDQLSDTKLMDASFLQQRGVAGLTQSITNGNGRMPAMGARLNADDVASVIAYLDSQAGIAPSGAGVGPGGGTTGVAPSTPGGPTAASAGASQQLADTGAATQSPATAPTAAPAAVVGGGAGGGGPPSSDLVAQGKDLFTQHCSACHGAQGDRVPSAKLADASWVQQRGDSGLTQVISSGRGGMPPFGSTLSQDRIAALVAFIKSLAGVGGAAGVASRAPAAATTPDAAAADPSLPLVDVTAETGHQLFRTNCIMCHGEDGLRVKDFPLTSPEWGGAVNPKTLANAIGGGAPASGMPSFAKQRGGPLSDSQIKAIIAYIKAVAASGGPVATP